MDNDDPHPHLKLVDNTIDHSHDSEFLPLPYYPWETRPDAVPLDADEVATALYIAQGSLVRAALLLKTPPTRVARTIRSHPRLNRVIEEQNQLTVAQAHSELLDALASPNDRRREWAAAKILASRVAAAHPFAPAPPQPSAQQTSLSLSNTQNGRTLTFRWRTDADPSPNSQNIDSQVIDGE